MFNMFEKNRRLCVKILIHLLLTTTLADFIWIYLFKNVWSYQSKFYYYKKIDNLQFIVSVLAYIEIIVKTFSSIILLFQYKILKGSIRDFLDFTYIHNLDGFKSNAKIITQGETKR